MAEGYILGREALGQIQQVVRDYMRREAVTLPQATSSMQKIYIAKSGAGGITACSSNTPGTANVVVYRINSDGNLEAATDSNGDTYSQTVFNLASSAVAGNTYIHLKQEIVSGKLLVDFEDCG